MSANPQTQVPAVAHAAAGGGVVGVQAKNGPADSTTIDLFHSDCLDGMATMADESVDIVVTSPPYNRGVHYGRYHDDQHVANTSIGASAGAARSNVCGHVMARYSWWWLDCHWTDCWLTNWLCGLATSSAFNTKSPGSDGHA